MRPHLSELSRPPVSRSLVTVEASPTVNDIRGVIAQWDWKGPYGQSSSSTPTPGFDLLPTSLTRGSVVRPNSPWHGGIRTGLMFRHALGAWGQNRLLSGEGDV